MLEPECFPDRGISEGESSTPGRVEVDQQIPGQRIGEHGAHAGHQPKPMLERGALEVPPLESGATTSVSGPRSPP